MIIKKEEWDAVGRLRKEELCQCQICGNNFEPQELRTRHLSYTPPFKDKEMITVCCDCNYRIHRAETRLKEQLTELNDNLRRYLKLHEAESEALVIAPVFRNYVQKRAMLTAEAIFDVVRLYAIPNRGTLDRFFFYPNIDEDDIIRKGKDLGVWQILSYAPLVKEMREEARRVEKEQKRAEKAKARAEKMGQRNK